MNGNMGAPWARGPPQMSNPPRNTLPQPPPGLASTSNPWHSSSFGSAQSFPNGPINNNGFIPAPQALDNGWPSLPIRPTSQFSPASNSMHQSASAQTLSHQGFIATPSYSDSPSNGAHLDRFAPLYVPLTLRQIAAAPPLEIIHPGTQTLQDADTFAKAIYPWNLYAQLRDKQTKTEETVALMINVNTENLQKLVSKGVETKYAHKLLNLQYKEFQARTADLAASTLYNVKLSRVDEFDSGTTEGHFKLEAPEIREGYPALEVNDVVFLRHTRLIHGEVTWSGQLFIAHVTAVKRALGLIHIRCHRLHDVVKHKPQKFIVSFEPQGRPYYAARAGVIQLDMHLRQDAISTDPTAVKLAQSWLFPSLQDYLATLSEQNAPPTPPSKLIWRDIHLNAEQRIAVKSIVYHRRLIPYLVSGPPGTGKTKTVCEATLQILEAHPSGVILLCGASNPSTDTLATRLAATLSPKEMFRLNDESRPFDEVSGRLMPYCKVLGDKFAVPDFATLRKYRVIVTSVLDSSILSRFTFTNNSLAQLEHGLLSQWQPEAYHPQHYHFDYFILDEAAQLSELDIAPALAVMLPSAATRANDVHKTRRLPQICLVGDFQQLGPFVSAPEARAAELDLSMLQRLFERSLYKDHPKARQNLEWKAPALLMPNLNGRNDKVATPAADEEEDLSPPLCNLVKNYRSHVGLIMVPSTSFYNDTLQPYAPEAVQNTPLLKWPALPSKDIPLLLWHTEGREDMIDEGSSFFNEEEITRVVSIVQELIKDSVHFAKGAPVKPADISIISPFREQVWKIRIKLRLLGLGEVNVGRESDMQGAENRVVIISPVRTSSRFLVDDRRRNRGLIHEPKRFNVATTRSKELLIICGHVPTLHEDPHWRALIHFSVRRGCYEGLTLQELGITADATTGVGKLEEVYVEKHGSLAQGEDTLAGSMARVVLEEA